MIKQPTKAQIATFFDVVIILAEHENKEYARTGQTIFPGLPRPIPEVKICLDWLFALKNGQDVAATTPPPLPAPTPQVKTKGVKKGTIPWNKGKKKVLEKATGVVGAPPQATFQAAAVPAPDELPSTVIKPGAPIFEYGEEVKGNVLIIPDDPTVVSNPR